MALIPAILQYLTEQENLKYKEQDYQMREQEWKLQKQKIELATKQQEMMINAINALPEPYRSRAMLNPDFAGKMVMLQEFAFGGQTPQQPMQQDVSIPQAPLLAQQEQPTHVPGPRFQLQFPEMTAQAQAPATPSLASTVATGKLGFSPNELQRDILTKEFGIGHWAEPVQTKEMINPESGELEMGQITRSGRVIFTGQPVPPQYTWRTIEDPNSPGEVIDVPFDQLGRPNFDLARKPPTEVTWIEGTDAQGNPTRIPVPTRMGAGGAFGVKSPVKKEPITITGPRGEESKVWVNPYVEGGAGATGAKAPLQVKPPEAGKPDVVARETQLNTGFKTLEKVKNLIFNPDGSINRKNLIAGAVNIPFLGKGLPFSKGKMLANLMFAAIDPIIRAATGAAVPPSEIIQYTETYTPTATGSDEQIRTQWETLGSFLSDYLRRLDPNEVRFKDVPKRFEELMRIGPPGATGATGAKTAEEYMKRKAK